MDLFLPFIQTMLIMGALIYGSFFINKKIKKRGKIKSSQNSHMDIIDSMSISVKEQIKLVRVGDELFLLSLPSGYMERLRSENALNKIADEDLEEISGLNNKVQGGEKG